MDRLSPRSVKILTVRIDSSPTTSLLRTVRARLAAKKKFYIVTPNPEQVVRAQTDTVFAKILNSADISIPDGIGLVAAHKFLSLPTTNSYLVRPILYFIQGLGVGFSILFDKKWVEAEVKVVKGRDLFYELIKLANKKGWRVFLLGDAAASAQKAGQELAKNFKNVELNFAGGPNLNEDGICKTKNDELQEEKIIREINDVKPVLLFIGFGAPKQEKWLYRCRHKLVYGGAMVVGGTFDYVSGKKKLPPKWVSDAGLEWLWRLIVGDQKIERIAKAFMTFSLKIFLYKLDVGYAQVEGK